MNVTGAFTGVLGFFPDEEALRAAVEQAQAARLAGLQAYLPFGDREVVNRLLPQGSTVRWVALGGGLFGIGAALFITIWMSWDYPLVVGGKPIVSWPPFIVICFEMMVLFGSLASVAGILWLGRLLRMTPQDSYDPRFAVDRFGLFVPCGEESEERSRADQVLREAGAIAVHEVRQRGYHRLQTPLEREAL